LALPFTNNLVITGIVVKVLTDAAIK